MANLKSTTTHRQRHFISFSVVYKPNSKTTNLQYHLYPSIDTPDRKKSTNKFLVEYIGDFCPALFSRFWIRKGKTKELGTDSVEGGGDAQPPFYNRRNTVQVQLFNDDIYFELLPVISPGAFYLQTTLIVSNSQ